jgi:hypothetical protein
LWFLGVGDGDFFPRGLLLLLSLVREVLILPQQHLQRRIDDMIRGAAALLLLTNRHLLEFILSAISVASRHQGSLLWKHP